MENTQRRRQLGIFVIAGTVLLSAMAIFFGGAPKLFQSRHHYTIVFDDAPGVVKGTPIRKSGVRIGEVESVELDDEHGIVRVHIGIDPRYTIRENEQAVIVP